MKYCAQCGSQVTGAFCQQCGASVAEDAVPTAAPAASGGENTWHEVPTHISEQPATPYAGYQSGGYNSAGPAAYNSAGMYASAGTANTGSAPAPAPKKSRSNLFLAGLVAVAAIAVIGLVGYLMLRPGSSKPNSAPSPSGSSPTASSTPSSTPTASNAPTQQNTPAPQNTSQPAQQANPAPQNTQPTQQSTPAPAAPSATQQAPSGSSTQIKSDGGSITSGDYTAVANGSSISVTGPGVNSTLNLNGYRSDWDKGQYVRWANLPGCSAPILVWNAGRAQGSAAFGYDGSGYQAYASSGGLDMSPSGGDGSSTYEYGVYAKQGVIAFNDQNKGEANYNVFDSCNGYDLHYARKGL